MFNIFFLSINYLVELFDPLGFESAKCVPCINKHHMVVGDDDHQTSLVGEGERSRDVDAVVDYLT